METKASLLVESTFSCSGCGKIFTAKMFFRRVFVARCPKCNDRCNAIEISIGCSEYCKLLYDGVCAADDDE